MRVLELSSGTIGYNLAIGADNLIEAGQQGQRIKEFENEVTNTDRKVKSNVWFRTSNSRISLDGSSEAISEGADVLDLSS